MTFREKLAQERPEYVDDKYIGGCGGCPHTYGYEHEHECEYRSGMSAITCRACWDREMPLTPEEQEAHDLEINEEIIRGYCSQYYLRPCNQCPAYMVCGSGSGTWRANSQNPKCPTSADKQRAMLDAFEAALPPEDDAPAEAAPREIPQEVRELMEARIRRLTDLVKVLDEQIKEMEAERDVLFDFLNKKEMEK